MRRRSNWMSSSARTLYRNVSQNLLFLWIELLWRNIIWKMWWKCRISIVMDVGATLARINYVYIYNFAKIKTSWIYGNFRSSLSWEFSLFFLFHNLGKISQFFVYFISNLDNRKRISHKFLHTFYTNFTLLQILREVWSEMWIFTCIQQIYSLHWTCLSPPASTGILTLYGTNK